MTTKIDEPIVMPVFCAHEQVQTQHTLNIANGELVASCGCGRQLKFPVTDKATFAAQVAAHNAANAGQVRVDEVALAAKAQVESDFLASLASP